MQGACTSSMYQRGGGDCLDQAAFRTRPPAGGSVHALFGAYTLSLLLILSWVLFAGVHHRVLQLIGHFFGDVRETQGSPARKKTAKRSQEPKRKKALLAKKNPKTLCEAAAGEGKTLVSACAAEPDEDDDLEAGYEIIHRSDTTDGEDSRTN